MDRTTKPRSAASAHARPRIAHTGIAARLALAAATALALAPGAVLAGDNMTNEQKNKVRAAISTIESALAGSIDDTLEDIFNPMGQGGSQIEYEDTGGDDTTLKEALNQLRNMLDQGRIQQNNMNGRGSTTPRAGTDSDRVRVNEDTIDKICNGTPVEKATNKFFLGATLINEMVHVYQKFEGDDAKQCDAERDSDCASIKYLEAIIAALTKPNGDPHESLDDIDADAEQVKGLKKCLEDMGVDTPQEIADVVAALKARLKSYKDRKMNVFEFHINPPPTSWGKDYYGSGYKNPIKFAVKDMKNRDKTTLPNNTGTSTRDFFINSIPGNLLVHSAVYLNKLDQIVLVSVSTSPLGDLFAHFWIDTDGDGLPELPEAALTPFKTSGGPGPRLLGDVQIYPEFHPLLNLPPSTNENGIIFLDTVSGLVTFAELGPSGAPSADLRPAFQQPALGAGGGFHYMNGFEQIGPSQVRFIFSSTPNVSHFGHVNSFVVQYDGLTGSAFPQGPGLTMAQAAAPLNRAGIETLAADGDPIVLNTDPGAPVAISSIGRGAASILFGASPGVDGRTAPGAAPILADDLFIVEDSTGDATIMFLPRLGQNIDCAVLDEDGDGAPDRLQLSTDPARLTFFRGVDSFFDIAYSIALENPNPRGVTSWEPTARTILGEEVDTELIPLTLDGMPPLFAQSILDFDEDGVEAEAVVVRRLHKDGAWRVDSFFDVFFAVQLRQQIDLPPKFEPNGVIYREIGGGPGLDIEILSLDLVSAPPICLINNGLGFFAIGPCDGAPCPADLNGDGVVGPQDLALLLGTWGSPGPADFDLNGVVNAADLATLLGQWGPCP